MGGNLLKSFLIDGSKIYSKVKYRNKSLTLLLKKVDRLRYLITYTVFDFANAITILILAAKNLVLSC